MDTVIVQCKECGYKKMIQLNPESPDYEKIYRFQMEKDCPNCKSRHSLEIINKE